MKNKTNLLTKNLLAAGYTAENHPDYVEVGRCCREKENPLDNLDGGFLYYRWWIFKQTFKTPCGLQCKGMSCMSSLSIGGIKWSFENDLATVHCPYRKSDCKERHEILQKCGNTAIKTWCNVHLVEEEYKYEGSVEGILKLEDARIRREAIGFELKMQGRVCRNHMHYDHEKKEWKMEYNPGVCAGLKCMGHCSGVRTENGIGACPIMNRPLDKRKGNVYYDIKTSGRRYDLDGTLFEGQRFTNIKKGVRAFEQPVSMDICRNYAKLCQDEIRWKVRMKYHSELFFAEYYGRDFSVEVINIRAEQRESRDLMQDLQDIRDGIQISHASDLEKRKKEEKKEKRKQSKDNRIKRMEKKILEVGYENMEPVDQRRADKLIDFVRLEELDEIRQKRLHEEKPVQLSLFDLPEMEQ